MARQSPRIRKEIRGWIIDSKGKERPVLLRDIGLGGAHLEPVERLLLSQTSIGSFCSIRVPLERVGDVTISARVVRNEKGRLGLRFLTMSRGDLLKIWTYIREFVLEERNCPYCNHSFDLSSGKCGFCGWALDFENKDYFIYWEKESLFRQLTEKLSTRSINDLRKVCRYLEERVLCERSLAAIEETEEFLGNCQAMREAFSLIRKVAPTDIPVLILGESGAGKELAARAIHERSSREGKPFVAINCAAIPESLIEAELFGHEKGAFTGAHMARKGKFEYADKGTLFLDQDRLSPLFDAFLARLLSLGRFSDRGFLFTLLFEGVVGRSAIFLRSCLHWCQDRETEQNAQNDLYLPFES